MTQTQHEVRDGMCIDWDAPITMDDGVVLRADVFRPLAEGRHPVILSYGPYAKGLEFNQGYKSNWRRLTEAAPEVLEGSSNKYQNWELIDPEKWVPDGYRIGFTVRGKDYEYDGTDAGLAHAAYPMRGVGPFTHTHPQDCPSALFGGRNTLHFSAAAAPYLLLPVIPAT
jgi:hypothetical protein